MSANTPSTLSGLFKEVYRDDVMNLEPDAVKILKIVPFEEGEKQPGNKYHQPVILSNEQGFTYAAFNAGAFALNGAIALAMQDAQVSSSQILLQSQISYDAAARAETSKKAFKKATRLIVENMVESMSKRVEIACLYGATGLATCSSSANAGTTSTVITISLATWATGIWAGSEGAQLDYYSSAGVLKNSNAALVISAVNITNRTITVTGNGTDITAVDSDISSPGSGKLYWYGAYGNEMSGLDKIITNTGTLFNISAATYALWAGNTYGAGSAALTMGKLLSANSLAVQRGLNEDATVMLNPDTWTNVMSDLAALRRYDGSYSKSQLSNGTEALEFHAQNGKLNIVSHNIVKQGEAFIFPHKKAMRIGAWDISFKTPGKTEEEIFMQLQGYAGYELRNYTDQHFFMETPARCVKITGIINA
jgi:hypothetical protein